MAVQDDVVAVGEGAFELDVLARIRICSARPAVSVPLPSLRRAAAAVVLQSMKPLEDFGVSEPAERGDSNGESTYASAPNLTHHRTRVNPYAQQSQPTGRRTWTPITARDWAGFSYGESRVAHYLCADADHSMTLDIHHCCQDGRGSVTPMDTEREPAPEQASEPEAAAESVAVLGVTQAPAAGATANLERDVRAAIRNGRFALATALCAAIVSSGVSAGSAIYVSTNQLERSENAEAAQAVRDKRQTAYAELATTLMMYLEELGGLKGELTQNPPDREEVRAQVLELADTGQMIWRNMITVLLVGNVEIVPSLEKFGVDYYKPFTQDHLGRFIGRNLGGSGETDEGLRQDGPPLITEIDRMTVGATDFLGSFVEQAREDLGIP
ncbi:hypothetical protein [Nocardia salmonicida]|uniref:hypothetical protein n=1 Tax=Nocardia salmonicida TaxID=53431 RepID=UPI0033F1DDE6